MDVACAIDNVFRPMYLHEFVLCARHEAHYLISLIFGRKIFLIFLLWIQNKNQLQGNFRTLKRGWEHNNTLLDNFAPIRWTIMERPSWIILLKGPFSKWMKKCKYTVNLWMNLPGTKEILDGPCWRSQSYSNRQQTHLIVEFPGVKKIKRRECLFQTLSSWIHLPSQW